MEGTARMRWTTKTPATPNDPSQGCAAGRAKVLQQSGPPPAEMIAVWHGSTVATNLMMERQDSPLVLRMTQDCHSALRMGRPDASKQAANLYPWGNPPRLLSPEHRCDVPEGLDHTGSVLQPPDETARIEILIRVRLPCKIAGTPHDRFALKSSIPPRLCNGCPGCA